jgi:hypothetical protein
MEAKIENGKLIVSIPISEHVSHSGKTIIIATSGGNQPTTALHNGKPVIIGLNAYVKK